jgi:hypothetical protein
MKSALACVVLVACFPSSSDDYPIEPGGPGAGGTTGGGSTGGTTTPTTSCDPSNLAGMTVTLGNQTAITAADGTFSMTAPTEPGLSFEVTSNTPGATVKSVAPVTPAMLATGSIVVPAVRSSTLETIAADNATTLDPASGQLFLNAASANGTGVAEIEAAASQSTAQLLYEDTATTWDGQSTGIHGAVWLTNATVGAVSMTLSKTGTNPLTVPNLPIEPGAVTFVTTDFE